MYFHTFFHSHVFLKNTNNITRITLPNSPQAFALRITQHSKNNGSGPPKLKKINDSVKVTVKK